MTERHIDLHTHSYCSDGSMSPAEVVRCARDAGLAAVALTDHDGADGVLEALEAGQRYGVEVVPGIELSSQGVSETHILGFYPDMTSAPFLETLQRIRDCRRKRMEITADLCARNGIPITFEEVQAYAGEEFVCRAHFARLMVDRGYAESYPDAFDRFLGPGKCCHFVMEELKPEDAVRLLKAAGAVVCCAHLNQLKLPDDQVFALLQSLKQAGLDGIEGLYTEYTPAQQESYQHMAAQLGLLLSGGSDFHGSMKPHIAIGRGTGDLRVPYSFLQAIKDRKGL